MYRNDIEVSAVAAGVTAGGIRLPGIVLAGGPS
jgi:hypothetical protein